MMLRQIMLLGAVALALVVLDHEAPVGPCRKLGCSGPLWCWCLAVIGDPRKHRLRRGQARLSPHVRDFMAPLRGSGPICGPDRNPVGYRSWPVQIVKSNRILS
jgi:hypothetical protein